MIIRFFTDPHLGLTRNTHTTPASRVKLKQAMSVQANRILDDAPGPVICLGDLFDKHDVDNNSLIDGLGIYQRCLVTLFGNHDLSNRDDIYSAIEVGAYLEPDKTHRYQPNEGKASCYSLEQMNIWWVDHKFSQEIFEQALQDAYDRAYVGDLLLLHCNYNSSFATQESTLNLTDDDAVTLLDKFSYVLLGHEHQPRLLHNGRLMILGNTHPTSFSDISDKYFYDFEIEGNHVKQIHRTPVWSEEYCCLELNWSDLEGLKSIPPDVQFISVNGVVPAPKLATVSRQVSDLWKLSEGLLMVRNNVSSEEDQIQEVEMAVCQSIPERITRELEGTKLEQVWQHYRRLCEP